MYKGYENKIKMVQEQWLQLKMKFLLVCNMKIVMQWGQVLIFGGDDKNLVEGESTSGGFFQVAKEVSNFWRGTPPISQVGKTLPYKFVQKSLTFFAREVPLLANIGRCPNFLDQVLTDPNVIRESLEYAGDGTMGMQ